MIHVLSLISVFKFPDKDFWSKPVRFLLLSCPAVRLVLFRNFFGKFYIRVAICWNGKGKVNGKQPGKTTNAKTNAEASVPVHPGSLVVDSSSSNHRQFIGKLEVIQKHAPMKISHYKVCKTEIH